MNKSIIDINSNCNKNTESINTPDTSNASLVEKKTFKKKPRWLRVKLPTGKKFRDLRKLVDSHRLHTICEISYAVLEFLMPFFNFKLFYKVPPALF